MIPTLSAGAIHVSTPTLASAIEACQVGGFRGLEFNPRWLDAISVNEASERLASANVSAQVWGVPFDWRGDEATQNEGLEKLALDAAKLSELGIRRCATWVLSGHNDRNWDHNYAFHVRRLRPVAQVLESHGMSLGLEFLGPKTLRDSFRYPFVHTLGEMLDLAAQVGPNVGLLLDAWHWFTSGSTVTELELLDPKQIVYVHVNDAPSEVEMDAFIDSDRRLPGDTGVIPLRDFFAALTKIQFEGPVAVEPFFPGLKDLPDDRARLVRVGESLRAFIA